MNQFFINKLAGVIISGESHREVFSSFIDSSKVSIIPNFAKQELFIDRDSLIKKYSNLEIIHLLFISNMIYLKGYTLLLEAFLRLDPNIQRNFHLHYAGRFDLEQEHLDFKSKVKDNKNITYHGIISEEQKASLFKSSHIFILPTMFFEGQPISILEAYASGCVVITTQQSGILDIFEDRVNGFLVDPNSIQSISDKLSIIQVQSSNLSKIALYNNEQANKKYQISKYIKQISVLMNADC